MSKVNKQEINASIRITSDMTNADIKAFINRIPDSAKPSVHVSKADPPYASDEVRLKYTWTEEF
jgi:hypothetical protein